MKKLKMPDAAPGDLRAETILDKRGFAAHWKFSVRTIDGLLAHGLPHLKIGKRRVRINTCVADSWMTENFGVQRIGKVGGGA